MSPKWGRVQFWASFFLVSRESRPLASAQIHPVRRAKFDWNAAEIAKAAMISAFPSGVDDAGISMSSKSTYSDRLVNERDRQARGANNPTLMQ